MPSPSSAKYSACLLIDRFNPLGTPRPRLEGVTEVLRLAKDLSIPKLHDTDSVGRLPIITDDIFSNPKIAAPNHAPNGEVLVGKQPPRRPDGEPTTDALAGLGVLQHGVVVVDLILSIVVTGLRRSPVPVQRSSDVLISHLAFLSALYYLGAPSTWRSSLTTWSGVAPL